MIRRFIIIAVPVLVLIGIGAYFLRHQETRSEGIAPASAATKKQTPAIVPPVVPDASRIALKPPDPAELSKIPPHPMAAALGSDKIPPEKEIAFVLDLFQTYRREFGGFPAGQDNAHFMNALRGANPGKLAIFPMEHPRLDAAGNLLDRWGQPYQFHPVSRDRLEIRSAGEDKQLFTTDDLVVPPQERR